MDVFLPLLADLSFQLWTVVAGGADAPLGRLRWNKEAEYLAAGTLQGHLTVCASALE